MKLSKLAGATSEIWQIFIKDSSSTTGAGLSGLANNTSGLTAYYHRDTDTTATVISLASMTIGTFTSSGFKEIDATHMPGWYQFCPPNAALASGAKSCGFHLQGAANMVPLTFESQLTAVNPDSASAFITSVATAVALTTNNDKTGYSLTSAYDPAKTASQAGDAMALTSGERASTADVIVTRSLGSESYAADGSVPTLAQALLGLISITSEFAISGTTITCKKLDGSTTSMTFTINDATTPTSRTRAT